MIECNIISTDNTCLDCKHSYVDDLFYEVCCELKDHVAAYDAYADEDCSYICKDFKERKRVKKYGKNIK